MQPSAFKITKVLAALFFVWLVTHTPSAFAETQESMMTTQEPEPTDSFTPPLAAPFSDITEGEDSRFMAINFLREQGLIHGYEDGTFKPEQPVSRAEALKILMLAVQRDRTQKPEAFNFADVPETQWFYPYVLQAWNNWLVQGYPDGLFHPEQTMNLAESLKIILLQEGEKIPQTVETPPYSDVATDAWFAPYAAVAKERTLWSESRDGRKLKPEKTMNRGDFAELIYKLIKSRDGVRFGRATWYGSEGVNWGTASGERFDTNKMAAAHKTLPFGTQVKVTSTSTGKSVIVTINDRGPYAAGMEIDLTSGAFQKLASLGTGIIQVEFEVVTEAMEQEETLKTSEYSF